MVPCGVSEQLELVGRKVARIVTSAGVSGKPSLSPAVDAVIQEHCDNLVSLMHVQADKWGQ